jgi:hypothetical protein
MASIAVATPFSYVVVMSARNRCLKRSTYGSDLFANKFRSVNLSLVCRGCDEGIGEILYSQLANASANAESLHTISPEELVAEERSNNGWNPS